MARVNNSVDRVRFAAAWRLSAPLRLYLRKAPLQRGKGLLIRRLLTPLLPSRNSGFVATLPGGGKVVLGYRDQIGLSTLMNGGFEVRELQLLGELARRGSVAVDVGANVGIFAVALGLAVGSAGKVLAFEPDPANARLLISNIELNRLDNVEVHAVALGSTLGQASLHLGSDRAYNSLSQVSPRQNSGRSIEVRVLTLDSVLGPDASTDVSVVKIDVEGGELAVLEGAKRTLQRSRATLLVEANDAAKHRLLSAWLAELGYKEREDEGIMPWNHLYIPRELQ